MSKQFAKMAHEMDEAENIGKIIIKIIQVQFTQSDTLILLIELTILFNQFTHKSRVFHMPNFSC